MTVMQYLYLLRAGESYYKVGIAANVYGRVSGLRVHNPQKIEVVTAKLVDDAYDAEQKLHESLKDMKASGANEWFELTPEQAIDLAIKINKHPDIDVSERATLNSIVKQQAKLLKIVENKLDYVINTYQKKVHADIRPKTNYPEMQEFVTDLESKPESIPIVEEDINNRAMAIFLAEGKASTSLLQRRLGIGYGRAARIMDKLEEQGSIGPPNDYGPRQVLV